jgi:hypothetical protein
MLERNERSALAALSSDGPLCNSEQIAPLVTARYMRLLKSIEPPVTAQVAPPVWAIVQDLPRRSRGFVLRSGLVRYTIDTLANPSGERLAQKVDLYDSLRMAANAASALNDTESEEAWNRAGYDCNCALTKPFPWIISAWIGIDGNFSEWNEPAQLYQLFNVHLANKVGASPCVLRPFTGTQVDELEAACEVLADVSPFLVRDVVLNIRHICMFDFVQWKSMDDFEPRDLARSVSTQRIPATCFLSLSAFRSPLILAETIYHETLHNKLSNLALSHDILQVDDRCDLPEFDCSWNPPSQYDTNKWTFDRAFHAYYVWVHLCLFHRALMANGQAGAHNEDQYSVGIDRIARLERWLTTAGYVGLASEGRQLLKRLHDSLNSGS